MIFLFICVVTRLCFTHQFLLTCVKLNRCLTELAKMYPTVCCCCCRERCNWNIFVFLGEVLQDSDAPVRA